jgi:small subunit ribosomal protein S9
MSMKGSQKDYIQATGRRRSSTAEVRLYKKEAVFENTAIKKGDIVVNNIPAIEYFGKNFENFYSEPLKIVNAKGSFAISVKVRGGGKMGQLQAVVLGVARALDEVDKDKFHKSLKKQQMLTRDPRVRERRKVGMGGKSRRKKQSPKR